MMQYVLITSARNEEEYVGETLKTVVEQTVLPIRWIIVDDGSTDRTAEIVKAYVDKYHFIQLISVQGDTVRNFGSKSKAVAHAYEQMRDIEFDYVGNLDADIALYPAYYEDILKKMIVNPKLGIAGGVRYDNVKGHFVLVKSHKQSVGGPIQFFRRECWEEIDGYSILPFGGVDAVAETTARMQGWEVESFPAHRVYHYRATGTANNSVIRAIFKAGMRDYTIGYHPLFELFRSIQKMFRSPYLIGFVLFVGYLWAMLRGEKKAVSKELVNFIQMEQIRRIRASLRLFNNLNRFWVI